MDDELPFLENIRANPDDPFVRLVYADWLDERGDARSEFVRADGQYHELTQTLSPYELNKEPRFKQLQKQLKKLAEELDPEWVAIFEAVRAQFFHCRECKKLIAAKNAIDTNPRNYQKMKTTRYCRTCYENAVRLALRNNMDSDFHGRYDSVGE